MAIEKHWKSISPVNFTSDGSSYGEIQVTSTKHFRVKQQVIVKSSTQPAITLEIKRVTSTTAMVLGDKGNINNRYNLSAYLASESAIVYAKEQPRNEIPQKEYERACFEEEPVVAKRTILVDKLGNLIDEDNPLPTDATLENASIEIQYPSAGNIQNVAVSNPLTEEEITLPNDTSKFEIQIRGHEDSFRLAFASGETSTNYIYVQRGNSYESPMLNVPDNSKIYVASERKSSLIFEIISWKDPI